MEEGKDTHKEKDSETETKRQRDRDHIKPLDLFYFIWCCGWRTTPKSYHLSRGTLSLKMTGEGKHLFSKALPAQDQCLSFNFCLAFLCSVFSISVGFSRRNLPLYAQSNSICTGTYSLHWWGVSYRETSGACLMPVRDQRAQVGAHSAWLLGWGKLDLL